MVKCVVERHPSEAEVVVMMRGYGEGGGCQLYEGTVAGSVVVVMVGGYERYRKPSTGSSREGDKQVVGMEGSVGRWRSAAK